jgi:hypothetical protein
MRINNNINETLKPNVSLDDFEFLACSDSVPTKWIPQETSSIADHECHLKYFQIIKLTGHSYSPNCNQKLSKYLFLNRVNRNHKTGVKSSMITKLSPE